MNRSIQCTTVLAALLALGPLAYAQRTPRRAPDAGVPDAGGPVPASGAPRYPSPMDQARTCLLNHDNICAIRALEGYAQSEPELGLLANTYRQLGDRANAVRTMRRYLQRFPNGPRSGVFQAYIAE